ncbi:ENR1 protein, partial [Eubucco bourcierii]|nr:ENR1 protein [Eubucco bourcierii]
WHKISGKNPFLGEKVGSYWKNPENITIEWRAPDGLFWICGKRAYYSLPKRWKGTCTLGVIQPAFFLLPKNKGNILGIPL